MTYPGLIISLVAHGLLVFFVIVGLPFSSYKNSSFTPPTSIEIRLETPKKAPPVNKVPPFSYAKLDPPLEPPKPQKNAPTQSSDTSSLTPQNSSTLVSKPLSKPFPEPKVSQPPSIKKPQIPPATPVTKTQKNLRPRPHLKSKSTEKNQPQEQEDEFISVLKNLQNLKSAQKKETRSDVEGKNLTEEDADQITLSEQNAVLRQLTRCWNIPAGAREAHNLIVEIVAHMKPDGTVMDAKIINRPQNPSPFYQAAAESALRAVLSPQCSPLNLPRKKYALWKTLTLKFNPQELF